MRYNTIADFGEYTVIQPTEPIKNIDVINIHRASKCSDTQQECKKIKHKKRRKKQDRELTISAYIASIVPFLSMVGMFAWWLVIGY